MPPSGTPALIGRISTEIQASQGRTIPFSEFMSLALYDPDAGYYAAGSDIRVGRQGDFYTSVSVGECFGKLLAAHFLQMQPGLQQVVEQGANDGQLANDLLSHLPADVEYIIVEPFAALREKQRALLGERARWIGSLDEIEGGIRGQFVCNELLDAFPVQRIRLQDGDWREIHINEAFEEIAVPIDDPALAEEIAIVLDGRELPDGYTTELHLQANAWTRELVAAMRPGARATLIDYGHEADDYYAPDRIDGTLRGFRDHRQSNRFLEHIGQTDLTASINFSRIADIANAGAAIDQHHFLIEAAKPWLAEIESTGAAPGPETQKLLRQFNTLIHPGLMGRSFKVLEIEKV